MLLKWVSASLLVVKNVHRVYNSSPEKVILISENNIFPPYEVRIDEIHFIGRVIWFSRKM